MSNSTQRATERLFQEPYDFSLVLGGPLYQLYRRAHLSGSALELLRRRVVILCLLAWLPLLALSALEGNAWAGRVQVPFLLDVHTQARFLVAPPLFIIAELLVHQRMRQVVRQFVERGLVPESMRPKLDAALASALRLRNSVVAEVLLLAFVYLVIVLLVWQVGLRVTTWYALSRDSMLRPTLAGWWFLAISFPLFLFMLLRWYFRLFIWARFLGRWPELTCGCCQPIRIWRAGLVSLEISCRLSPRFYSARGRCLPAFWLTESFLRMPPCRSSKPSCWG